MKEEKLPSSFLLPTFAADGAGFFLATGHVRASRSLPAIALLIKASYLYLAGGGSSTAIRLLYDQRRFTWLPRHMEVLTQQSPATPGVRTGEDRQSQPQLTALAELPQHEHKSYWALS